MITCKDKINNDELNINVKIKACTNFLSEISSKLV
jgi:hypothetical protein